MSNVHHYTTSTSDMVKQCRKHWDQTEVPYIMLKSRENKNKHGSQVKVNVSLTIGTCWPIRGVCPMIEVLN